MAYRFIFGGAGSGKSYRAYNECIEQSMLHSDEKFLIIIPEQAGASTEKEIINLHPDHATENIDILSFNRLAYKVFRELKIDVPDVLDDMGKSLIIRRIAAMKKDELSVWKKKCSKPGFIAQISSMISELYQYGIKPDDLEGIDNSKLTQSLQYKLDDISILYHAFSEYIRDKYITTEEIPDLLCDKISESNIIKGVHVVLDGFTGFTPIQYRILEQILIHAKDMTVTVTISDDADPYGSSHEDDLFAMSKTMTAAITDIAAHNGINHSEDIYITERPFYIHKDAKELDFLEQHILRYDNCTYSEETDRLQIIKAVDVDEEASWIAGHIAADVRNKGLRFKDIAIICGDEERYKEELNHQLKLYDIPCYIDERISIDKDPLTELISAALDCISSDYTYEALMRYLKTGLVDDDKDRISLLDNYIYQTGKRGHKAMTDEWTYLPRNMRGIELESIVTYRDGIIGNLDGLYTVMNKKDATVSDITEQIRVMLDTLKVEEKLQTMKMVFEESADSAKYREYDCIYDEVCRVLNHMDELIGDEIPDKEDYVSIWETGVSEISVGMIPAGIDRVTIGNLTRTRLNKIKTLYVCGVNEGSIPKLHDAAGVLTDREKTQLKKLNLTLSPTIKEDLYTQRYYLYRMLSMPSDYLYISYAGMDKQGNALRESSLLGGIKKVFSSVSVIHVEDNQTINTPYEALNHCITMLKKLRQDEKLEDKETFETIYNALDAYTSTKDKLELITEAALYSYIDSGIGKEAAISLYGKELRGSVTRMEDFAGCAYKHFLKYGLNLRQIEEYSLEAVDIGNIVHSAIEKIYTYTHGKSIDICALSDDERDKLAHRFMEETLKDDLSQKYTDSERNKYIIERVDRIVKRSLWVLTKQQRSGDFVPYGFEVGFDADSCPDSMRIDLDRDCSIALRGKIDRIDICEAGDDIYAKIIDYKTGKTKWDMSALDAGKQIQLVMYMDAVMEMMAHKKNGKEVIPAALFYYHIQDPIIDRKTASDKEEVEAEIMKQLRPDGLINSSMDVIRHLDKNLDGVSDVIPVEAKDELKIISPSELVSTENMKALKAYVHEKVKTMGRQIMGGDTAVKPMLKSGFDECEFCPYGSVCGFDQKIPGYRYKRPKFDKDNFWEKVNNQDGTEVD